MKRYLKNGSITPWKAFLFFQLLGWFAVVAVLTLLIVAVPKTIFWIIVGLLGAPYVIYSSAVFWVNTGDPKKSVVSALAKLWAILYLVYGIGVLLRMATNA